MTTNESFANYMASLKRGEKIDKQDEICKALYVNKGQLWRWENNRAKLHPLFLVKISEVVGKDLMKGVEID